MKEPIWIRERRPSAPPPFSLQPVLTIRKRGIKQIRDIHARIGWLLALLTRAGEKRNPIPIEMTLMRYRLLILLFSVSLSKS